MAKAGSQHKKMAAARKKQSNVYSKQTKDMKNVWKTTKKAWKKGRKKKGCYIATAVYGSYDCPQVWTLRRYRDNVLDSTWYGRIFIQIYYSVSPLLVKWFGNSDWFRNLWKVRLDGLVNSLNQHGFEGSPYSDQD